jgi:hypothetical protein
MRIALAMATWGFVMATGLAERCGHPWSASLETGEAAAVALFVVSFAMVTASGRRNDG